MNIAVCGSGFAENKEIIDKAKQIGKEIANSKDTLLTGAGTGYPHAALLGALSQNGKTICYSPAKNKEEHIKKYNFPFEKKAKYIFTNMGIPGRNLPLIQNSDSIIIVGGQIGTLNEFTIAFAQDKKIGILKNSGKLIDLLPKIAKVCNKIGESKNIIYSNSVKKLINKLTK